MEVVLYFQSQSKTNAGEKLGGVQAVAALCGWLVQVVEGLPPPRRLAALMDFWRPVGAIVEAGGTSVTVEPAVFGALPVVFFDHDPSSLPQNAFCVTHDSVATAQMAARELMLGGARAFAFVPYPERRFWSDERERGFLSALALNGRACRVFPGRPSAADPTRYQRKLRAFLAELPKPCALFAANDRVAAEVLTAAAFASVNVPDDLTVIGVDDAIDICEHTTPTLSSVKPDFRRGGEFAALLLAARIHGRIEPGSARRRTFGPLTVVRRASSRKLAASDGAVAEALDLIRREACTGLAAQEVLKRFPCSRRQAEIRFRRATGRSVLEEMHAVRLERAKQLLREGVLPLKAISDFCGFASPNALRKFFRSATGLTMTGWRERRLTDAETPCP